jgi:hypothetical protein
MRGGRRERRRKNEVEKSRWVRYEKNERKRI